MNWKRIAFAVGGVAVGALGVAVPWLAPFLAPVSKFLIGAGAGMAGVAVRTPGHVPVRKRDEGPTQPG